MAENPKPFDQGFKQMFEAHARDFLDVTNILPASVDAELELLGQEIAVPPVALDAACVVRVRGEPARIVIFEALSHFHAVSLDRMVAYGTGLVQKYDWAVEAYMLPLAEHACPRNPPARAERRHGGVYSSVDLNWIRLWELDAAVLLAKNKPTLDAWTVLCKATDAQLQEAFRRVRMEPSEAARMRILAGLRYREDEESVWTLFLERMNKMLTREDLRASLAVQEWLAEGEAAGLAKGRAEGRVEGRVEGEEFIVRRILASRFPGLAFPETNHAAVNWESLADRLVLAPDEAAAQRVLDELRSPAN